MKQEIIKLSYIHKKYAVCLKLYEFVKVMCMQNPSNQVYAFKFISFYLPHLGFSPHVSELLIEIIRDNEKLLYGLHQVPILNKILTKSFAPNKLIEVQEIRPEGRTFLGEIVSKFKDFPQYEKQQLLQLLKASCSFKDHAIYINQDKVFKLIYEDYSFRSSCLVNFHIDKDELFLSLRGQEYAFDYFFTPSNLIRFEKEINFLKSQLDLYAVLCMNRNYSCAGTFRKIFRIDMLIRYIKNEEIPEDIRATLVKLIVTIHIDKEPRTVQEKPNLVRVVEIDLEQIKRRKERHNLQSLFGMDGKKADKKKIYLDMPQMTEIRHINQDNKEDINIIVDEEMSDELLDSLKKFVLNHLEAKSLLSQTPKDVNGKLYTRLTYEVIQMTGKMLKFGMFNSKIMKQGRNTHFLAGTTHDLITKSQTEDEKKNTEKSASEIEKLIRYLTPLLEFDEEYFKAMSQLGVKRSKHLSLY